MPGDVHIARAAASDPPPARDHPRSQARCRSSPRYPSGCRPNRPTVRPPNPERRDRADRHPQAKASRIRIAIVVSSVHSPGSNVPIPADHRDPIQVGSVAEIRSRHRGRHRWPCRSRHRRHGRAGQQSDPPSDSLRAPGNPMRIGPPPNASASVRAVALLRRRPRSGSPRAQQRPLRNDCPSSSGPDNQTCCVYLSSPMCPRSRC